MRTLITLFIFLTFSNVSFSQVNIYNNKVDSILSLSSFGDNDWAIGLVISSIESIPMYDQEANMTVAFNQGQIVYIVKSIDSFFLYQMHFNCRTSNYCIELNQKIKLDEKTINDLELFSLFEFADERLIKLSGGEAEIYGIRGFYIGDDSCEYKMHFLTKNLNHSYSFNSDWFRVDIEDDAPRKQDYQYNRSTKIFNTFTRLQKVIGLILKE